MVSHHLVLGHATRSLCFIHDISSWSIGVFDEGETERTTAVLVAGEFGWEVTCQLKGT